MEYAMATAAEWGITGFPNIADDGPVHIGFGIFGHPAAVAISAGGSVVTDTGELDRTGILDLMARARERDA